MSFPCNKCHKSFRYQKNLNAHQNVCKEEKSDNSGIKCVQCEKIFSRISALQEHPDGKKIK